MTAPTPAPVVLLPLSDDVLDQLAERLAERLPGRAVATEEPLLLTCSALCRKLGVSRASVYRWRGEGMPSVRAFDEFRYELTPVLSWLRSRGHAERGEGNQGA